jgi:hypothetical protein
MSRRTAARESCGSWAPGTRQWSWRRSLAIAAAVALPALDAAVAGAQPLPLPGQNINMVSGTQWPGGDPFLQRQNEPSIAVSSRNHMHLMAGANDYRSVDLPVLDIVPGSLAGDAWLGVFKSVDGAQSWTSTLLPGYPQDQSPQGLASPLKAYSAAADPTVRPANHGLFHYSGIAFNRGTNEGAVFVSQWLDLNNKENGDTAQGTDPIKYVRTTLVDTGTSGQFLDKPWIAVDIPRGGAATCTFSFSPTVSIPAGNVYIVWSRFTGSSSTKIMFSRSLDCGKTWSNPIKVSESNSINQGGNLAVDLKNGDIYLIWRRFASSSEGDAILSAKSTDFGKTFPSKFVRQVAAIAPFDQGTTPTRFRTNTLPTIAASLDANNVSRVHAGWAQRHPTTGDAQIVVATSTDGLTWGSPVKVDAAPIADDFDGEFARGHQFMPQLHFVAGRVFVLYYDQRLDHTLEFHIPNNPFEADSEGRFYLVRRDPKGELPASPASVFTLFLDDALLTQRRHTVDVRVAEAVAGSSLVFRSATVSSYRFGLRAFDDFGEPPSEEPEELEQLESNPPNLPLFGQGTVPFLGDYIDIAGQTIKSNPNGTSSFNTSATGTPVVYATWTSNHDVKPPQDGDWTHYTPAGAGGQSVLDPTQSRPVCVNGQEGMRNQNIYSSRITEGLLVGSPQNIKPLSATLERAFVVTLQNFTDAQRTFHIAIANQPAGGHASFLQGTLSTALDVTIGPRSGAARPVFATSSNPAATITVNVTEQAGPDSLNLAGSIVLNPEGTVSPLAQPDGTDVPIGSLEIYSPAFSVWNATNPNRFLNISNPNEALNISNPNISNPNISNADPAILNISNPNISNLNISNLNISNQDPAVLNISNLNISNTTVANPNISNPNISNLNISNTPITDTTYAVTNTGNTTHSYRVALFGSNTTNAPIQLIVTKNTTMPTSVDCQLQNQPQGVVLADVDNATVEGTLAAAANPNISNGSVTNATAALAPGETIFVTLRAALTPEQMALLVRQLTPVVTAHGANTGGVTPDFALLLFIQVPNGGVLPAAVVGTPYSETLQASGGKPPLTWTLVSGALPGGLSLSTAGVISGTPTVAGDFTFGIRVTDSASPGQSATQTFQINVGARASSTTAAVSPASSLAGESATVTATVSDAGSSGGASSPAGTVDFTSSVATDAFSPAASCALSASGPAASACAVSVSGTVPGPRTITATYPGSAAHSGSSGSASWSVKGNSAVAITSDTPDPSLTGQAVAVSFTVSAQAPATGTPTGTVTVGDGSGASCSATLSGGAGSCSLTLTVAGARTLTASYGGDALFNAGSGTAPHQVDAPPVFFNFTGFQSPLAAAGTLAAPSFSGNQNLGSAIRIKWMLTDAAGKSLTSLATTQSLKAIVNTACSGPPTGAEILLYSPTSGATGGSTFRSSSSGYIFNWDTSTGVPTGAGCYTIVLQLSDGSPAKATTVRLQ